MRAAVYARRSTPDEANVAQQLERGAATCAQAGWTVVEEFKDDGVSAWQAVQPGAVQPRTGVAVVAELDGDLVALVVGAGPQRLELRADGAALLLGFGGHAGIQRDTHQRTLLMSWSAPAGPMVNSGP